MFIDDASVRRPNSNVSRSEKGKRGLETLKKKGKPVTGADFRIMKDLRKIEEEGSLERARRARGCDRIRGCRELTRL
jgi:hypothetical protein